MYEAKLLFQVSVGRGCTSSQMPPWQKAVKQLDISLFLVTILVVLPGSPSQSRDTRPAFSPPLLSGLGASRAFLAEE